MLVSLAKKVSLSSSVSQTDGGVLTFITLIAGLSSSLPDQVKQILEVVGTALRSVSSARRKQVLRSHEYTNRITEEERVTKQVRERIRRGIWHDPRMGAAVGGGVIAELGVGDEPFGKYDEELVTHSHEIEAPTPTASKREGVDRPGLQALSTLPVVVLKNYSTGGKEEVMDVFAKWAAALVEGKVRMVSICERKLTEINPAGCSCSSHKR